MGSGSWASMPQHSPFLRIFGFGTGSVKSLSQPRLERRFAARPSPRDYLALCRGREAFTTECQVIHTKTASLRLPGFLSDFASTSSDHLELYLRRAERAVVSDHLELCSRVEVARRITWNSIAAWSSCRVDYLELLAGGTPPSVLTTKSFTE